MKLRKISAVLTLSVFALNGIAYPQASVTDSSSKIVQAPISQSPSAPRLAPDLNVRPDLNPYNIAIPEGIGRIEEVFQGSPDSPLIIHIQNAHANYEAQVNIKKIISSLVDQYGFSLIQLEGAVSKLNPDTLKPSYLEEANVKLADFLMREGRITGADAYMVETKKPVELYGIEDQLLYLENIRMFKQIYSHQTEVTAYFNAVHGALDAVGRKLLAPGPLDFTRKSDEFSQDKIDLMDYLLYLNGVAEKTSLVALSDLKEMVNYPNLVRIVRLHALEKQMNQSALKKEGAELKAEFVKRKIESEEVNELFDRFEDPQKGTKPRDYFLKLSERASEGDIEFLSYPQLRMFAEYLIYQDEIDHKAVFEELLKYKNYLETELFKKEDEKKFLELVDYTGLLEQYFRLEMSRDKIARYLEHRDQIKPSSIAAELEALAAKNQIELKPFEKLSELDSYMPEVEYFYQLVLKRDGIFIDKVMSRMDSLKQDKTILVTGGFHKDGMTEHFRKQNLSYIVISPKVGVEQGNENYIKVMLDQDVAVGGAFAGSFAIEASNLEDTVLATPQSNYLKLNLAAATAALTVDLDQTLKPEQVVERVNKQLETFSEANGHFIRAEVRKADITGNLATAIVNGAIHGEQFSLQAELQQNTREFTVKPIDQSEVRFDRNVQAPQGPLPEVGNQAAVTSRFNLERLNLTRSVSAPPTNPNTTLRGTFENSLIFDQFFADLRNPIPTVAVPLLGKGSTSASKELAKAVKADISEEELGPLVEAATKEEQVAPKLEAANINQALQGETEAAREQISYLSGVRRTPTPRIIVIYLSSRAEVRDAEKSYLENALKINTGAVVVAYGEGASQLAFDPSVSGRIKAFDVPADEALAVVTIKRNIESGKVANIFNSVFPGMVPIKQLQSEGFIRYLTHRVGGSLGDEMIRPGLNVLTIQTLDLENPEISGDPELENAVVWTEIRISDLAPTFSEVDEVAAALLKNGLNGIMIQIRPGVWGIAEGTLALVKSLYGQYLAAVRTQTAA